MAPHEFLLPINLKKSKKMWKFGFFYPWPLFGLQKIFWPFFDFTNLQMYSNLNHFEAILPLKKILLKILQTGSVCYGSFFSIQQGLEIRGLEDTRFWIGSKTLEIRWFWPKTLQMHRFHQGFCQFQNIQMAHAGTFCHYT